MNRAVFESQVIRKLNALKTIFLDDRLYRVINTKENSLELEKSGILSNLYDIILLIVGASFGSFIFTKKWFWFLLTLNFIIIIPILKLFSYRKREKRELKRLKGGKNLRMISKKIIDEGFN